MTPDLIVYCISANYLKTSLNRKEYMLKQIGFNLFADCKNYS